MSVWFDNQVTENIARLGFVFEYKDEKAFKSCLPVWKEIETLEMNI